MSIDLSVQEKRKIDFQNGHHGGHLGFTIRKILAVFDLQRPGTSYQILSQLAFSVQEWQPSWFSD